MSLGMNDVIMANSMISLITSSTTDPRMTTSMVIHVGTDYTGRSKYNYHAIHASERRC